MFSRRKKAARSLCSNRCFVRVTKQVQWKNLYVWQMERKSKVNTVARTSASTRTVFLRYWCISVPLVLLEAPRPHGCTNRGKGLSKPWPPLFAVVCLMRRMSDSKVVWPQNHEAICCLVKPLCHLQITSQWGGMSRCVDWRNSCEQLGFFTTGKLMSPDRATRRFGLVWGALVWDCSP